MLNAWLKFKEGISWLGDQMFELEEHKFFEGGKPQDNQI